MTFTKQFLPLFFLVLFVFPFRHSSIPRKCPSSYLESFYDTCGRFGIPIRFPFCGHEGFNLHCNNLNKTVLELPMSGTFLVEDINYMKQQISISDPDNCLVKRLLTFNTSGSPFSYGFSVYYTFLTCPNEVVPPSWSPLSISCLSNATSSFFATSNLNLLQSMPSSCQIVKRLVVPVNVIYKDVLFGERTFSTVINIVNLLLEWSSPNCRGCEIDYLRCGFKNKASLEVKCFDDQPAGHLSSTSRVIIITLCTMGGLFFAICIALCIYKSERFVVQRRQNAGIEARSIPQQPRVVVTTGLDQSTIESYKKVELGESRRLPGTNGIICPICLSEYATKETVRLIPECDHCFHVQCIDPWLKIHGSCPVCRNSRS